MSFPASKKEKEAFKAWILSNPNKSISDVYNHHKEWTRKPQITTSDNPSKTKGETKLLSLIKYCYSFLDCLRCENSAYPCHRGNIAVKGCANGLCCAFHSTIHEKDCTLPHTTSLFEILIAKRNIGFERARVSSLINMTNP